MRLLHDDQRNARCQATDVTAITAVLVAGFLFIQAGALGVQERRESRTTVAKFVGVGFLRVLAAYNQ